MKIKNVKLLCLAIIMLSSYGCSNKQDVAPIQDPTNYPLVTITPMEDYSNITEGDVLEFTIEVDKFFDQDIDFSVVVNETSTGREQDISVEGGTFVAFTQSTSIVIEILADNYPEVDESYSMEISAAEDKSYNFQLSPNSDVEQLDFTVANVNTADVLTLGAYWEDDHDDWDMYLFDSDGNQMDGYEGATGSDPEIIEGIIDNNTTDGVYDILLDAYDVENEVTTFELSIAKPNGDVEVIITTIDLSSDEEPQINGLYRIATITKSGSSFSLSAVD